MLPANNHRKFFYAFNIVGLHDDYFKLGFTELIAVTGENEIRDVVAFCFY